MVTMAHYTQDLTRLQRDIGWDYAHVDDYIYRPYAIGRFSSNDKKYSTKELIEEAQEALKELEENNFRISLLKD